MSETRESPAREGQAPAGIADVAPGMAAVAGTATARTAVVVAGRRKFGGAAVTPDTRFDLASLTKVMATLPSVLSLAAAGELDLDDPVRRFFGNAGWFQQPTLADATVRQLLAHTSGLPAWKPLFAQVSERRTAIANALQTDLDAAPGAAFAYSDLGFIVLGAMVERVAGVRLDAFARERVFAPLNAGSLQFRGVQATGDPSHRAPGAGVGTDAPKPGPTAEPQFAATEDCGWRGMLLEGVVHDENAWVMDGVAGHAGLFGTADDVATYAQAWLRAVTAADTSRAHEISSAGGTASAGLPFPATLARESIREQVATPEIRRGLGWQLASTSSPAASPAGERAGPRSFGHTGFTGTSVWIDPDAGWFAVLLTNRVHPTRFGGEGIGRLRRAFHDRVAQTLEETA